MFVTLLVTVCINLAVPGTCVTERVVDSSQDNVGMMACMGLEGITSAIHWWHEHPLYHAWKFKGWACQIGNRAAPARGGA
jgi:hypothetical protein